MKKRKTKRRTRKKVKKRSVNKKSKTKTVKKTKYVGVKGIPIIRVPGGSVKRHTGSWRVWKPKIDLEKCKKCRQCFINCPEGCIKYDKGYPEMDYNHCKGCMLCFEVCMFEAISKEREGEEA